jgi:lysozyme
MQKRLISIFCLLLLMQFTVFARKSHKSHGGRKSHKTHKTAKAKHIHQERPSISLSDIVGPDNVWGIDVSHYQSDINWAELDREKPNFMFIKASEGLTFQDIKYMENYSEAKKLGILVGSYHFFSYSSSGKEQATNFLSVAQHKNGDLLPVLDAEFRKKMPEKSLVTTELTNFVNAIYEKLGHYPIIYCNYAYYKLYLEEHMPPKCKLWIVDYRAKPSCEWAFWQKTNRFKLAGIRGHVDLNIFNGTALNLQNYLYKNPTD